VTAVCCFGSIAATATKGTWCSASQETRDRLVHHDVDGVVAHHQPTLLSAVCGFNVGNVAVQIHMHVSHGGCIRAAAKWHHVPAAIALRQCLLK
jgi:hypothetical protein